MAIAAIAARHELDKLHIQHHHPHSAEHVHFEGPSTSLAVDTKNPQTPAATTTTACADNKPSVFEEADEIAQILPFMRFDPQGQYKRPWDITLMVVIMYSVVMVPYSISTVDEASGFLLVIDYITDVFFTLDILFNFCTCYEDPITYKLETRFSKIAWNYCKGWFLIDLVSTLPLDTLAKAFNPSGEGSEDLNAVKLLRALRLVKLVRLSRLMKLDSLVESAADVMGLNPKYLVLVSLSLNQFFVAHLMACIWIGVSSPRGNLKDCDYMKPDCYETCEFQPTWVFVKGLQCHQPSEQYMVAMYWAFATMTTVGYGDVVAINDTERLVSIFLMLVGVTIFGYTILMVALVIADGDPRSAASKSKMIRINYFLNKVAIPPDMKERIRGHYTELVNFRETTFENPNFVDFLDPHFRANLSLASCLPWQKKFMRVTVCLENAAIAAVYDCMRVCTFLPGETIFEKGDLGTQVYFVITGRVGLHRMEAVPSFREIKEGRIFGVVAVLTGSLQPFRAVSLGKTTVAFIPKTELMESCSRFPRLHQNLLQIAAELVKCYEQNGGSIAFASTETKRSTTPIPTLSAASRKKFSAATVVPEGIVGTAAAPGGHSSDQDVDILHPEAAEVWLQARDLLKDHWLIHPTVPPKVAWDLVVAFFIIYSVLIVPYRIGFGAPAEGGLKIFDVIGDVFFFLDLLLSFRTSFVDPDSTELITQPCRITTNYLMGWFTVDFVSTFPADLVIPADESGDANPASRSLKMLRVLRLFKLLKLLRLFKLTRMLGSYANRFYIPPVMSDFMKNLLLLVFFSHLYCCLWYYASGMAGYDCSATTPEFCPQLFSACCNDVGTNVSETAWAAYGCERAGEPQAAVDCLLLNDTAWSVDNWVANYAMGPDDLTWTLWPLRVLPTLNAHNEQYLTALYWTYATFLSVGYGDLTATLNPLNGSEVLASLFGMCLGTICFAMFLSAVCEMVRQAVQNSQYKEIISRMKEILSDSLVSKAVITKMKGEYIYFIDRCPLQYSMQSMLYELPSCLKIELVKRQQRQCHGLLTQPFFEKVEKAFPGFLGEASHLFTPMELKRGNCVLQRGESFFNVFFILKGDVEVVGKDEKHLQTISAASKCPFFGQVLLAVRGGVGAWSKVSVYTATTVVMVAIKVSMIRSLSMISPILEKGFIRMLDPEAQLTTWLETTKLPVKGWPGSRSPLDLSVANTEK